MNATIIPNIAPVIDEQSTPWHTGLSEQRIGYGWHQRSRSLPTLNE